MSTDQTGVIHSGAKQDKDPSQQTEQHTEEDQQMDDRQVAAWLERWTSNRKVARSNPRAVKVKSVVRPLNKAVNPLFLGRH